MFGFYTQVYKHEESAESASDVIWPLHHRQSSICGPKIATKILGSVPTSSHLLQL